MADVHDRLERLMIKLMPWWDPAKAAEREARAEAARQRAIKTRQALEKAYQTADSHVRRP